VLAGTGWEVPPPQVLELGIQAVLVLLHGQDAVGLLGACQERGVAVLVGIASALITNPARSTGSSSGANGVISLFLRSTLVWASTALVSWSQAASRWTACLAAARK
jgi:hypothetical protein